MDSHSSSASLKQLQKQVAKEEKHEDKLVKQSLKDLSHAHKVQTRVQKAQAGAAKAIKKAADKESSALQALNKATHKHDIAVADIHKAENDAKMMENQSLLAQRSLEEAKTRVDILVREQKDNKKERGAKLADFEHNLMTSD